MRNKRMTPTRPPQREVYERLSQRLEAVAEREGRYSNAERIALLRQVMFPDEDELEPSGQLVLPK